MIPVARGVGDDFVVKLSLTSFILSFLISFYSIGGVERLLMTTTPSDYLHDGSDTGPGLSDTLPPRRELLQTHRKKSPIIRQGGEGEGRGFEVQGTRKREEKQKSSNDAYRGTELVVTPVHPDSSRSDEEKLQKKFNNKAGESVVHPTSCFPQRPFIYFHDLRVLASSMMKEEKGASKEEQEEDTTGRSLFHRELNPRACGIMVNAVPSLPWWGKFEDSFPQKRVDNLVETILTELQRRSNIEYVLGLPVVVVSPFAFELSGLEKVELPKYDDDVNNRDGNLPPGAKLDPRYSTQCGALRVISRYFLKAVAGSSKRNSFTVPEYVHFYQVELAGGNCLSSKKKNLERLESQMQASAASQPYTLLPLSPFERTLLLNMSVKMSVDGKKHNTNPPPTISGLPLLDHFELVLIPATHHDLLSRPLAEYQRTVGMLLDERSTPVEPTFSTTIFMSRRVSPLTKELNGLPSSSSSRHGLFENQQKPAKFLDFWRKRHLKFLRKETQMGSSIVDASSSAEEVEKEGEEQSSPPSTTKHHDLWGRRFSLERYPTSTCAQDSSLTQALREFPEGIRYGVGTGVMCMDHTRYPPTQEWSVGGGNGAESEKLMKEALGGGRDAMKLMQNPELTSDICTLIRGPKHHRRKGTKCDEYSQL